MDIEKELKEIEKEVINIENKVDGLGKKLLLLFILLFTNRFMLFCQILSIFPAFVFSFTMAIKSDSPLSFIAGISLILSPFLPLLSISFFETIFKFSKRKKLTKKEQYIFNMSDFFYKNKKTLKHLDILFNIKDISIDKNYFNSVINFLYKKSNDKLKKDYFHFFSDKLLEHFKKSKINQNEFNNYLFKYIKAAKIEDKKLISDILKNKEEIVSNLDISDNKVQQFLSGKEILDNNNQTVLQKDNIKF